MLFSDSDLEDAEIQKAVTSKQKKGATIRQKKVGGSRLTCIVIIIINVLGELKYRNLMGQQMEVFL